MTKPSANAAPTSLPDPAIKQYLEVITVVMVNTTLPANIGSAARAMHTMGLQHLTVIDPKHPIDDTSIAHAAGAQALLEQTQVLDSLDDALANMQLVFAASSRQRHIPRPVVTPTQAADIIAAYIDANRSDSDHTPSIAVLFGREDRGLTNSELARADYHIQIDANPAYPVLNVASAVQVIASFFYSAFLQHNALEPNPSVVIKDDVTIATQDDLPVLDVVLRQLWDTPAINQAQKLSMQTRLIDLMHRLELVDSTDIKELRELPSRLTRLVSRLQLDQKEYELLSAVVAKVMLRL